MAACARFLSQLTRKKTLPADIMNTPLRRCLNTFDLTLMGIGHMVGGGIYVLTGTVARKVAGPGVVLSYLFSGLAAMLSAICYAEFGARLPKTGSAYTFTYVTVGEIWAFIIGWNIILEHALGAASVARAWSGSLDAMVGGAITNGTMETIGRMDVPMLGHYPDFVAVAALFGVIIVVAIGVKVSSVVNSVLTVFNIICVLIIIFVGFFYIQPDNWNNPDHGGFLPFGFFGVFGGAATCFYAYVGFESIVLAGEETQNPEKSIPIATMVSLTTATVLYIFSSAVLTLMIPYFEVDLAAPFPNAFGYYGLTVVKYIVAVGSILGTSTSLLGSMFALPRSVYAMAVDRLFFGVFDRVSERTQTPLLAIVVFGALSALLGLLLDIDQLVQFLSVGTLLSYTMVAVSLLVLRYEPADRCHFQLKPEQAGHVASSSSRETLTSGGDAEEGGEGDQKHLIRTSQSHDNIGRLRTPFSSIPFLSNTEPGRVSHVAIVCLIIFISAFSLTLSYGYEQLGDGVWWVVCLLILSILGIGLSFTVLLLHEHNKSFTTFQIPLVPLLPTLSIFLNILMMLQLHWVTWLRLGIWNAIGFAIYFGYGMRESLENYPLSTCGQLFSYSGSTAKVKVTTPPAAEVKGSPSDLEMTDPH